MACINPDGSLTPSARTVLESLQHPGSLSDIARKTNMPLYRVRMSLRELSEAGLLVETVEGYQATEKGLAKLAK